MSEQENRNHRQWSDEKETPQTLTMIVPPVCVRKGLNTFRCTRKLGRNRSGGISVIVATTKDH